MATKKKIKKASKRIVKKLKKKVVKKVKKIAKNISKKIKKPVKKVIKNTKKIVKKVVKKKIVKKVSSKVVLVKKIEGKKVGVVTHWFGNINVAIFKLSASLNVGDKIKIVRNEVELDDIVNSMQMNHEAITSAKKGMEVGVKIKKEVHEGAEVYVI